MARAKRVTVSGAESIDLQPGVARPLFGRAWRADLVRLSALGALLDVVDLESHRFESVAERDRGRGLLLVAVRSGRVQGVVGDAPFEVLPGQVLVMDTRLKLHSTVTEDVRLLRALVSGARFPHGVLPEAPRPAAVLSDSPVVRSCLAAANTLLQRCYEEGSEEDDAVVGQLVAGLQISMLHEVLRRHPEEVARASGLARRDRVEQYIALHLADPELSPPSIARALGISVRSVHAAFNGTGTTVTASIRTHRITRLQNEVALLNETPSTRDLTIRYGFSNTTHLRRVFEAKTGRSLQDWLRNLGPMTGHAAQS